MSPYAPPPTRFPVLREILSEELALLDDAQLAEQLAYRIPGVTADELEINFRNMGRSLGRGMRQAGGVLAKAAPGALSGAVQGASMGAALGPYGMLAGAAIGAVGGGIASYSQSQQQQHPTPQQPRTAPAATGQRPAPAQPAATTPQHTAPATVPLARQVPPPNGAQVPPMAHLPARQPVAGAPGAHSSAAAAQLLGLLARPEVIQSLLAMAMGPNGRRQIQVGSRIATPEEVVASLEALLSTQPVVASAWDSTESVARHATGQALLTEMSHVPPETHPLEQALTVGERPYSPVAPSPEDMPREGHSSFPDWPRDRPQARAPV